MHVSIRRCVLERDLIGQPGQDLRILLIFSHNGANILKIFHVAGPVG